MYRKPQLALMILHCVAVSAAYSNLAWARDPAEAANSDYEESAAVAANRGFKLGLGPILILPTRENGPYGGGLILDGRYGFRAGPTILAPGARLTGYLISGRFVGMATPTFRITVPIGPLAPFVLGGVGPGWISNPSETGVAVLAGAGLMIHAGRFFAIGCEATYQAILGTDLKTFMLGPAIAFGG